MYISCLATWVPCREFRNSWFWENSGLGTDTIQASWIWQNLIEVAASLSRSPKTIFKLRDCDDVKMWFWNKNNSKKCMKKYIDKTIENACKQCSLIKFTDWESFKFYKNCGLGLTQILIKVQIFLAWQMHGILMSKISQSGNPQSQAWYLSWFVVHWILFELSFWHQGLRMLIQILKW